MKIKAVCPECSCVNSIVIQTENKSYTCSQCKADLDDPSPVEVTDESCELYIKEDSLPLLVDFYSNYCAPCLEMFDDFEGASFAYSLKVRFLKVNTDNYQKIAKEYGVASLPTIIAFKNGEEVNRVSGTLAQYELNQWAKSLL